MCLCNTPEPQKYAIAWEFFFKFNPTKTENYVGDLGSNATTNKHKNQHFVHMPEIRIPNINEPKYGKIDSISFQKLTMFRFN